MTVDRAIQTTDALEFFYDGTNVEFFVNGTNVGSHTANIPNDELLTPSIHFLTGAPAAKTMTISGGFPKNPKYVNERPLISGGHFVSRP